VFASLSGLRSTLAAAIATLLIVALFEPLRGRVQNFVDRRFYRARYDIARTLTEFSAVARDEVSLERLKSNLFRVIEQTMNPETMDLCNCLDAQEGSALSNPQDELRGYLVAHQDVLDIERTSLKSPALEEFRQAGASIIVPLVAQGELVGMLNLGRRRGERPYTREDRRLLGLLASQVAPALRVSQMIQQQQVEAQEKARLAQEMKVASLIQHTLLPHAPPNLPGWQISAHYQPARAVGGDFYDFVLREDGRLMLSVGDVTDKGVPAALIMATTRSVLRGAARRMLAPDVALQRSNNLLCPEMLPNMFVTCFYAILDPLSGQIDFANAGHCLPCLHHPGGEASELYATGMPLGLIPDMQYNPSSAILQPGDSLLLYSDGLIEAHSPARELYGVPRLKLRVASLSQREDFFPAMLAELKEFCGPDAEQEDDVTMVLIKRL
jgi:serine phosphatase RsbU (regulator of sigma subunit)